MKCKRCNKREGVIAFAKDGMLGYTHGMYEMVCRQCYVKILENNKKVIYKSIKDMKDEIKNENKTKR